MHEEKVMFNTLSARPSFTFNGVPACRETGTSLTRSTARAKRIDTPDSSNWDDTREDGARMLRTYWCVVTYNLLLCCCSLLFYRCEVKDLFCVISASTVLHYSANESLEVRLKFKFGFATNFHASAILSGHMCSWLAARSVPVDTFLKIWK